MSVEQFVDGMLKEMFAKQTSDKYLLKFNKKNAVEEMSVSGKVIYSKPIGYALDLLMTDSGIAELERVFALRYSEEGYQMARLSAINILQAREKNDAFAEQLHFATFMNTIESGTAEKSARCLDAKGIRRFISICQNECELLNRTFLNYFFGEPQLILLRTKEDIATYTRIGEMTDKEIIDVYKAQYSADNIFYVRDGFDVGLATLLWIVTNNLTIKQCQNCGKYFIPTVRSDELYCNNPSPQEAEFSCKVYASRRRWYDRKKQDDALKLQKAIASKLNMRQKRNPDIKTYRETYENFKKESQTWLSDYKKKIVSQEEFIEWLNRKEWK